MRVWCGCGCVVCVWCACGGVSVGVWFLFQNQANFDGFRHTLKLHTAVRRGSLGEKHNINIFVNGCCVYYECVYVVCVL